jgi:hypothetical protein
MARCQSQADYSGDIIWRMKQTAPWIRRTSVHLTPRNAGRAVIGLGILCLVVPFLIAVAVLPIAAYKLRTMELSGLDSRAKALQSEITAIQNLARLKSSLERDLKHPGVDSSPPNEKK